MNYIDADKLKAEIERRLVAYQKNFDEVDNKIAKLPIDGRIASLKALLPFIDFLQQEQQEEPIGGYNEAYLQEKIAKARNTWKGVDVDKYMAELRGYELPETE